MHLVLRLSVLSLVITAKTTRTTDRDATIEGEGPCGVCCWSAAFEKTKLVREDLHTGLISTSNRMQKRHLRLKDVQVEIVKTRQCDHHSVEAIRQMYVNSQILPERHLISKPRRQNNRTKIRQRVFFLFCV